MDRRVSLWGLSVLVMVACSSGGTTGTSGSGAGDGEGGTSGSGSDAGTGTSNACGQTNGTSGLALCGACDNVSCCTEIQACAASDDCKNLQTCSLRCTSTDVLCNMSCQNLYPGGTTTYENLINCAASSCGQACSMPPQGCSNVPLGTTGDCNQTSFPRIWSCPDGPPEPQCVASPTGQANLYCCLQ